MDGDKVSEGTYKIGRVVWVIIGLAVGYGLTAILLYGLAFIVYRYRISAQSLQVCLKVIGAVGALVSGYIACFKRDKGDFIIGCFMGFMYIALICIGSMIWTDRNITIDMSKLLLTVLCVAAGGFGGAIT